MRLSVVLSALYCARSFHRMSSIPSFTIISMGYPTKQLPVNLSLYLKKWLPFGKRQLYQQFCLVYALKDMLNANEFCLFYQAWENKTMHFKGQKCSGKKHNKIRLTGLAAGNEFGERLLKLVIGKSQNPDQTVTLSISIPIEKLDVFRTIWRMGSRVWPKVLRRKEKNRTDHR